MIQRLEWDSAFFGRPMATLTFVPGEAPDVGRAVADASRQGYQYLMCKLPAEETALVRALCEERFYLSDQGITWAIDTASFRPTADPALGGTVVRAAAGDVPALQRLARGMFFDSRFYNDPFFSTEDADRLHEEWLKNSVAGVAADGVLWVPETGFVTLKTRRGVGEVHLIGVQNGDRGRGIGRALLASAMAWFAERGLPRVTIRTQLRNYRANNFYRAHGFSLDAADVTFSRML